MRSNPGQFIQCKGMNPPSTLNLCSVLPFDEFKHDTQSACCVSAITSSRLTSQRDVLGRLHRDYL
jgi:hypothetical protein